MTDLSDGVQKLFAAGKGILAADESGPTADKRLTSYGIESSEEMRRQFRELFLCAPGASDYLSGVILYHETLNQETSDGIPFAQALRAQGIVPGIKVDEGTEPFPDSKEELITKGLLGLPERLADYRTKHQTGFTKWRAVVTIDGDRLPTARALVENAKRLATYAREVQEAGMVPLVEPEVLLTGSHSRLRSRAVLEQTLATLMEALTDQAVDLSGVVLKSSMALSGSDTGRTDSPEEVAEDTLGAFMKSVSPKLGGIVFLSGGQTPDQATDNLRAIVARARSMNAPWPLTFSYARALQDEALAVWQGNQAQIAPAREAFLTRLKKVSEALSG